MAPQGSFLDTLIARHRSLLAVVIYAVVTAVAYGLAWLLRFDFTLTPAQVETFLWTLPVLLAFRLGASRLFRLTLGRWRFVSLRDVRRLLGAVSTGTVGFTTLVLLLPEVVSVPRSILALEWGLSLLLTAGIWSTYRTLYEFRQLRNGLRGGTGPSAPPRRVLIVGAGEAGNLLAREILRTPTGYRLVGFVDDDPLKQGTLLQGVSVVGTTAQLPTLAQEYEADEIILAVPSAAPSDLRRVVEGCEALAIPFRLLPGIRDVLEGSELGGTGTSGLGLLRPLRIEDLLGREPVDLELPELARDLEGQVALVTGAAGSIGSELCRQIALHRPAHLIALDVAESPLFELEQELRERFPDLLFTVVVGSVLDTPLVDGVFKDHGVNLVYHAAAFKHVPLMEVNTRSALLNNVLGTLRVAEAAGRHGAGKFVLISTDKAVRPSSVMGATKRLAEWAVTECQRRFETTVYTAVRFGNVLGSNGSVVPIFQRQIRDNKPLTVTDPRVTRYFMTIAEAVQLVLQASLLKEAEGSIAMLDMGEPVKIVDLARKMIRLSGADPAQVRIEFTGLRPGEKLHEELYGPEEVSIPTPNPKVRIVMAAGGDVDPEARTNHPEDSFLGQDEGLLVALTPLLFADLKETLLALEAGSEAAAARLPLGNLAGLAGAAA